MQQDYERIGWEVPGPSATMEPRLKQTFLTAVADFMKGPDNAVSGDELTFMVSAEVLRRVEPALLIVNFSDVEVAHFGVYSAHLAASAIPTRFASASGTCSSLFLPMPARPPWSSCRSSGAIRRIHHQRLLQPSHQHRREPRDLADVLGPRRAGPPTSRNPCGTSTWRPLSGPSWASSAPKPWARCCRSSGSDHGCHRQGAAPTVARTFVPALNEQIDKWDRLFPVEQRTLRDQLDYLAGSPLATSTGCSGR